MSFAGSPSATRAKSTAQLLSNTQKNHMVVVVVAVVFVLWLSNRTGKNRTGEPRPLVWTLFVWVLPWTPLWDVSWELLWEVLAGLKTGKINPRGRSRERSRGRSRGHSCGRSRGRSCGPTQGPTRGPTRGSNFAFACSVRHPCFPIASDVAKLCSAQAFVSPLLGYFRGCWRNLARLTWVKRH